MSTHTDDLSSHLLKVIPAGPGVHAFFCFRPTSTANAFNVLVYKGVIYLSSPDHGALTLMPFAPDALVWLERCVHDDEAIIEAIPENLIGSVLRETFEPDTEEWLEPSDSTAFFIAALRRFVALRRQSA